MNGRLDIVLRFLRSMVVRPWRQPEGAPYPARVYLCVFSVVVMTTSWLVMTAQPTNWMAIGILAAGMIVCSAADVSVPSLGGVFTMSNSWLAAAVVMLDAPNYATFVLISILGESFATGHARSSWRATLLATASSSVATMAWFPHVLLMREWSTAPIAVQVALTFVFVAAYDVAWAPFVERLKQGTWQYRAFVPWLLRGHLIESSIGFPMAILTIETSRVSMAAAILAVAPVLVLSTMSQYWARLRQAEQQLVDAVRQAGTDPLTGLANRTRLTQLVPSTFDMARRADHGIAVLVCDLDHFKQVNDTMGHHEGDVVLRLAAAAISDAVLGRSDVVARVGGEEFVVMVVGEHDADLVARRIRATVEQRLASRGVTTSVGYAVASCDEWAEGTEIETYDALLRAADAALYEAKRRGRNRVVGAQGLDAAKLEAA